MRIFPKLINAATAIASFTVPLSMASASSLPPSGGAAAAAMPSQDTTSGNGAAADSAVIRALRTPMTGRAVPCQQGKAGIFDCRAVELLAFLPKSALGGDSLKGLSDLWGWTDTATGREFVILGRKKGTVFVEITDPVNPKYLGLLPPHPTGQEPSVLRDMKVYRNYTFIVADLAGEHGMQVFDLTRLLNVTGPPQVFESSARYDKIGSSHNLALNEATGFAYSVGPHPMIGGESCTSRLHMIDVRNPTQPTFAGCAGNSWGHDTQCVLYSGPDAQYQGREICLTSAYSKVVLHDVTDKAAVKQISAGTYPNASIVHQGWFSEDHRYFFVGDEGDENRGDANTRIIVFDLQDLDDPVVATEFFGPTRATDHNLYIHGQRLYQASYKAGIRIIDISTPTAPEELAYLDTTPLGDNDPTFSGAFSNYPFFPSGVVAVSSMGEGLFLVRYRPAKD